MQMRLQPSLAQCGPDSMLSQYRYYAILIVKTLIHSDFASD